MRGRSVIAAIGVLACARIAAQQRPSLAEQSRTLEIARGAALNYARTLPDFICTEIVQRFSMLDATVLSADKLTVQLTYFGQKEQYNTARTRAKCGQSPSVTAASLHWTARHPWFFA